MNEGQAITTLKDLFGLDAPMAFDDVKKKYRQESKRLHPDAIGCPDPSGEMFKALSNAFDHLKKLFQIGSRLFDAEPMSEDSVSGESAAPHMPRETIDGTPLSELGLGLGPTTNGKECLHCDSHGYTATKEHGYADCNSCKGSGYQPREFWCHACSGSGRFVQKRSQREVDCRVCQGSGKFKHPKLMQWCRDCDGNGRTPSKRVVRIYVLKCSACRGTGEIEVWNPVIPKGRLTGLVAEPGEPVSKNTAQQKVGPTKDRLFGDSNHNQMKSLMQELAAKGIGGKTK